MPTLFRKLHNKINPHKETDMATITRESAEIKSFITGFLSDAAHDNQSSNSLLANVFRIALASLEAKPIGAFHIAEQQVDGTSDYLKDGEWPIDNGIIEVYAAPPVPVIQADVAQAIENLKQKLVECNRYNYCADAVKGVEDACRAAMLQGKDDGILTNEDTKGDVQVRELTMLIKQLVSQLRKAKPDCKLPEKAMVYLKRNGLISAEDILR